ncbi:class I SAM-dependent methyltransferase [soil metagenome]
MNETSLDENILFYYNRGREQDRLERDLSRVEYLRTLDVLARYLPAPPATVVDIGGGPGRYAVWLAAQGYTVCLLDPVPLHVEQARATLQDFEHAEAEVGDTRALPYPDKSADAVLLLGPLYHLTERADRSKALEEAKRVLKPGGTLFAAAISRFASFLDGLSFGFLNDPAFAKIVDDDLQTGVHQNLERRDNYFTTAYFHRPEELSRETEKAALKLEVLIGLEGPSRYLNDLDATLAEAEKTTTLLNLLRTTEKEPSLLGMSPHILAVATSR